MIHFACSPGLRYCTVADKSRVRDQNRLDRLPDPVQVLPGAQVRVRSELGTNNCFFALCVSSAATVRVPRPRPLSRGTNVRSTNESGHVCDKGRRERLLLCDARVFS
jgi:hypothetical protein